MKNKEIVKAILPKAVQESHKGGLLSGRYYLIRNGSEYMYLAAGETGAQAWNNAVPVALERARKAIENQEATIEGGGIKLNDGWLFGEVPKDRIIQMYNKHSKQPECCWHDQSLGQDADLCWITNINLIKACH